MKCVTIINKGGAVHSVPVELYKSDYARNPDIRVVKESELAKLSALSEKLSKAIDIRQNAETPAGKADNKARSAAAMDVQRAKAAIDKYKSGLVANDLS